MRQPTRRRRSSDISDDTGGADRTKLSTDPSTEQQHALIQIQRQRQPLTFAEKNAVRQYHAEPGGDGAASKLSDVVAWVERKFGKKVGRSSIGRIVNSAVDPDETAMGPQRMRKRFSKYPAIEAALLTFVLTNVGDAAQLTDESLCRHARAVAHDRFVTTSWIYRFKSRNGLNAESRALLASNDKALSATRDAFVAALTKTRDELLRLVPAASDTTSPAAVAVAPVAPEPVKRGAQSAAVAVAIEQLQQQSGDAVVAAAKDDESASAVADDSDNDDQTNDPEPEQSFEPTESDDVGDAVDDGQPQAATADAERTPLPQQQQQQQRDSEASQSRKVKSPRFGIVSQTTGRVELENRSSSNGRHESFVHPTPSRTALLMTVAASSTTAPSFATPLRPASAPPTTTSPFADHRSPAFGSPSTRIVANRRTSVGGSSSVNDVDEQLEDERKRKVELEERELELRVEGLRCDNVLKRIRIAEENMLARKRLRDAGISDAEINDLLPVVRPDQV